MQQHDCTHLRWLTADTSDTTILDGRELVEMRAEHKSGKISRCSRPRAVRLIRANASKPLANFASCDVLKFHLSSSWLVTRLINVTAGT